MVLGDGSREACCSMVYCTSGGKEKAGMLNADWTQAKHTRSSSCNDNHPEDGADAGHQLCETGT